MLKKFQKIIFKYLKNMKTCAPTGAAGIGCKCYRVQLVIGSTGFHQFLHLVLYQTFYKDQLLLKINLNQG